MEEKVCECGERFIPSGRGKEQIFCSVKCRMRAYRRRTAKKRNVTIPVDLQKTVDSLRKENRRLHQGIETLQKLLADKEQKKTLERPVRCKTQKRQTPCPICGRPVRLIIDDSGFTVPRHREQSGRRICKGSNLLVTESGDFSS